jgi:hypothetical protein
MGARNWLGIGLSYRPARLHSLAELVPWNRFMGFLKLKNSGSGGPVRQPYFKRFLASMDCYKIPAQLGDYCTNIEYLPTELRRKLCFRFILSCT